MLLIVASPRDEVARQLAVRWKPHDACLLTPLDLSTAGWRYDLPAFTLQGSVMGRTFADSDVRGVLSRLPRVFAEDLGHIVEADRSYVATEMTAFLIAWLSRLPCPVVNAPTPGCLAGPEWRRERWIHLAARLGMKVRPLDIGTSIDDKILDHQALTAHTIIGNRTFGDVHQLLARHVRRMARVAGVDMLTAYFDGSTEDAAFVDANPWPDLANDEAAELVLQLFLRGNRC